METVSRQTCEFPFSRSLFLYLSSFFSALTHPQICIGERTRMGVNLSTIVPEASKADIRTVHLLQVARYYTIATVAVGVWDCIVCFPKEYYQIWKSPNSMFKYLYITCRYGGLLALSFILTAFTSNWTFERCSRVAPLLPGLGLISTLSSDALLSIRTIALWEKNKYVTYGLVGLLLMDTGCLIASSVNFVALQLPPGGTGCYATGAAGGRSLAILYWSVPLAVSALVFWLTMHRALIYWRRGGGGINPLLKIIIRDQTMYFAVIFAFNLLNVIFYSQNEVGLQPLNSPFAVMITSILSCRLVLNLKGERGRKTLITIPGGAEIPHVVHLQTYHQFNAQENRGEGANVVRDLESGERDTGNGRRILDKIKAGARIQIPGTVYVRTEKVISESV